MTEKLQKRKPRSYTDEFQQQLALLYQNRKLKCDIFREYDIATSLLDKWLKRLKILALSAKSITVQKNSRNYWNCLKRTGSWKWGMTFKTSGADFRTKVNVIKTNARKYSVSAMCKVLQLPRSAYYYEAKNLRK